MMRWFFSLTKKNQIAICILLIHSAIVCSLTIDHSFSPKRDPRHPIFVRSVPPLVSHPILTTTSSGPPNHVAVPPATQPVPVRPSPQKMSPGKINKKKTIASKPVSKKAVSSATKQPQISQKTIHEIERSLSSLSSPPRHFAPTTELTVPSPVSHFSAAIEETPASTSQPPSYIASLIDTMQNSLQLPEIGRVRLKLVISQPNQIAAIEILDADSAKNAAYLKNELPLLELPSFQDFGIVDAVLEWTITFSNVENH